MKVLVSLENYERISKGGNAYNVALITIKKEDLEIIIEDFKVKLPFSVEDYEMTIEKVENRYVISDISYSIPWQYSIAIGMLFLKYGGSK